jgi:hypothetical protein
MQRVKLRRFNAARSSCTPCPIKRAGMGGFWRFDRHHFVLMHVAKTWWSRWERLEAGLLDSSFQLQPRVLFRL